MTNRKVSLSPDDEERGLAMIGWAISSMLAQLELLILATPSGERRNLLTEMNMHAMAIKQALSLAHNPKTGYRRE